MPWNPRPDTESLLSVARPADTEPLTAADHQELLATAEYLARAHKPHREGDHALLTAPSGQVSLSGLGKCAGT